MASQLMPVVVVLERTSVTATAFLLWPTRSVARCTATSSVCGTLLTGGVGYVVGTFIGVLLPGVIHTYLTLDGSLTPWWIKIIVGALFLGFILMQKLLSSRADFARPLRSLRRADQQQPV